MSGDHDGVFAFETSATIELAVFVSGVASIGLEIVAGRALAPIYGSSRFTWGTVIGVFLAALALGYWLAGRRARTQASRDALGLALVAAAAYVVIIMVAGEPLMTVIADLDVPRRYSAIIPVTVLFGPPTVLLGFVSPFAAELIEADSVGDASGRVYALGTAGSILGAFGTTFVLLTELGVLGSELLFGVLLLVAAILVVPRSAVLPVAGVPVVAVALAVAYLAVGGVAAGSDVVHAEQTTYQELTIEDDGSVRTLYLDGAPQSAMDLENPARYLFDYSSYVHLALLATGTNTGGTPASEESDEHPLSPVSPTDVTNGSIDRVLFIGGGGFTSPTRFVDMYNVTVDVVELDPAVVRTARTYFNVSESDDLRIHTMDGRVFLQETNHTYDVIVLDAYRARAVPYHLTTVEFMQLARRHLEPDGVLFANLISSMRGPDSAFFKAEYRTVDRIFPHVYVFPTTRTDALQNIELVATKHVSFLTRSSFEQRNRARDIGIDLSAEIRHYRGEIDTTDAPLLRDDRPLGDSLLAKQVNTDYVIRRSGNDTITWNGTGGARDSLPSTATPEIPANSH